MRWPNHSVKHVVGAENISRSAANNYAVDHRVVRYDDGRLTVTELNARDFAESHAQESYSEGLIDHLRAVEGTAVAALISARWLRPWGMLPRKSPLSGSISSL